MFTNDERLALAGFLAGYTGLTREAYALDLRQFTTWCQQHHIRLFQAGRAGNIAKDDGAIDSGEFGGGGSVTVIASTFAGNTAYADGAAIDSGEFGGGGTVTVAADVFADSCGREGGTWHDQGYNAATDWTCFAAGPDDLLAGSAALLDLGPLASNGGPTRTIMPQPGSPAIGIIPNSTLVTLPGGTQWVCPVTDQRGSPSPGRSPSTPARSPA